MTGLTVVILYKIIHMYSLRISSTKDETKIQIALLLVFVL